jgi:hypothetical protein
MKEEAIDITATGKGNGLPLIGRLLYGPSIAGVEKRIPTNAKAMTKWCLSFILSPVFIDSN